MAALAHFDDATFDADVLRSPIPVVVDFFADWCGPCKALTPIVEELARDYAGRVKIGQVDVDHATGVANQFEIRAVPTLILFKNGQVVEQITGYKPKAELRRHIDALLA